MKIALIAVIHGNIPALEAVEADLKQRGITTIYCLGDMIARGPNGAAVIDWCRANCEVVILGNWESHVINGGGWIRPFNDEIGEERRQWLSALSFTHKMWLSGRRVHMFHGRPLSGIIWHNAPDEEKLLLFGLIKDEFPPDILICADIHRQYKTDFKDDHRFMFNTGSVGSSYCTPTACYAILNGKADGREKAAISVEFVSLPYDNQKAVENALNVGDWFPSVDKYIVEITQGIWQDL